MRSLFLFMLVAAATPATASWHAANPAVEAAARNPRIAGALAATAAMDKAILAHDFPGFVGVFAPDAVVNNPFNKIARTADAERNMRTGLIDYATLERSIEYAALRGAHDVVLMGEEVLDPVGKARFAGKKVRRRTTEVWSDESGKWQLAIRQATIYSAD